MKNKKIITLMAILLVASQSVFSVVALGEIIDSNQLVSDIKESNTEVDELDNDSAVEEELIIDESTFDITDENQNRMNADNRGINLVVEQWYKEMRIGLGSTEKQMARDIKVQTKVSDSNGSPLGKSNYYITDIETNTDTDVIGKNGTISYTVTPVDQSKYNSIRMTDVEVEIYYGDTSFVFETDNDDRFAAAFSIDAEYGSSDNIELVASSGKSKDNDVIASSYGNTPYYKLDIFRKGDGDYGFIEDDMVGDVKHYVNGNERKQDALKKWNNKTTLNQGDIIRTWAGEPKYNTYYSQRAKVSTASKYSEYRYGYIWSNQFHEFGFSRLILNERIIPSNVSDDYLEKTIERSFSNQEKYDLEFEYKTYPDRSKLGRVMSEIVVKEYVVSYDTYIYHTFEVPFFIVDSNISIDVEDVIQVPVGTDLEYANLDSIISAIYEDGEEVDINDYELIVHEEYDSSKVGNENELLIELVSKEDDTKVYLGFINVEFIWGNTIGNKAIEADEYEASISLLHGNEGAPYLSSNQGDGLSAKSSLTTNPRIKIFEKNDAGEPMFSVESLQDKSARDTMNHFNTSFWNFNDFKYGDVLVYENSKNGKKSEILTSRDESMINEVAGYDKAYYELTKEGYYLLKLNQLKVSKEDVTLAVDEDMSEVSNKILNGITLPDDIEKDREIRLELDESSIDVKTIGTDRKAQVFVYEKLKTNEQEFMTSYQVPYKVEESIEVKLKENSIPVGTPLESVNANDYIEYVSNGTKKLDPKDYTATIDTKLNTQKVSVQETQITVDVNGKKLTNQTRTNILWGHTIGSSADGTDKSPIDISVSMIHTDKNPSLVANEGNGLAGNASSLSYIHVYRNSDSQADEVFYSRHYYPKGQARETMDLWNNGGTWWNGTTELKGFKDTEFHYGDVVAYEAKDELNPGSKTWASRNEKILKETEGYQTAYYEMTEGGFNLLQLNQLSVNNNILVFNIGETQEQINAKAESAVVYPEHITDKDKFTYELDKVDTKTSGKKKGRLNVYETLKTDDKKFMTSYEVEYVVNHQVTETFNDTTGEKLAADKFHNFDFGGKYEPNPENFVTFGEDVYVYRGWLTDNEKPGEANPRPGKPETVTNNMTIHYIYEKAENLINVTVPTELLFATEKGKSNITSEKYEIKNNSKEVATEVSIGEFKKEKSDIQLLKETDSKPIGKSKTARLNLVVDNEEVIKGLTETTKDESIISLDPEQKAAIAMSGEYNGNLNESNIVHYQMGFKFKIAGK